MGAVGGGCEGAVQGGAGAGAVECGRCLDIGRVEKRAGLEEEGGGDTFSFYAARQLGTAGRARPAVRARAGAQCAAQSGEATRPRLGIARRP